MSRKIIALITAVVLGVIFILAAVAWFVPIFKVDTVEIMGATRTDIEQAEELSGITAGDNFLRIDATQLPAQ